MCSQSDAVAEALERLDERMTRTIEAARQMGRYEARLETILVGVSAIQEAIEQLEKMVIGVDDRLVEMESRQLSRDRRLGEQLDGQENLTTELGALLAQAYRGLDEALRALQELGKDPVFVPPTGHAPSTN